MTKKIEKIDDLVPDPNNANKGTLRGLAMLEDSLQENGAGRSVLADKNGVLIAGNKTVERALELGMDIVVVPTDGKKLVVVQRTDLDLQKDKRARELAYADNRVAEIDLEWNIESLLADMNDGVDLAKFFDRDELDELLASVSGDEPPGDPGAQIDRAGELQEKYQTAIGQIWQLGSHRLAIGDCTDSNVIQALMQGKKAQAAITDPPYNVDINYGDESSDSKTLSEYILFTQKWFDIAKSVATQVLLTPGTGRGMGMPNLHMWFGIQKPDWILIWVKKNTVVHSSLGGFNAWEPIFFFGKPTNKIGQDIYDIPLTVQQDVADDKGNLLHPTPKQVSLWKAMIEDFTNRGDVVYEPFSGSGTTLIACEQTGRVCFASEIEPKYAAVAIQRWVDLTGQKAVLCDA